MGTLHLVATPIGNLEDITARALRVLREASLIAAEDTRHTGRLLAHFGIATPLLSYHAHNERARRERLLAALATGDVALVSDAGTPGISDPGRDLVLAALAAGHSVSPVPGPSAVAAAVGVSGLVEGPFVSLGFLPRRGAERRRVLARAGATGFPVVLFEAPGRLAASLAELAAVWGDREAVVMRELTKLHEESVRGTLSALADRWRREPPRGEIVVVVGGAEPAATVDPTDAARIVAELRRAGLSPSAAAREAAAVTGLPRSELYRLARRQAEPTEEP
jgi:16S rRNA (cytidine1402-2'-O)-methyltransferase